MRGKAGPTEEQREAAKAAKAAKAAEAAAAAKAAKEAEREAAKAAKAAARDTAEKEAAEKKAAKEAEKQAKAAAKAGIGHNSSGAPLNDDEKRALLVNGIGNIVELEQAVASANSNLRNERKRLISHGFEKFEIDFALKLRKSEDSNEDLNEWRKLQRVALFMNHPIGTQPDLFGTSGETVDRTPLVDRTYTDGKQNGMEGKTACVPPHDASSEAGQSWIRGWHDGQAMLMKNFKPTATIVAQDKAQASFGDVLEDAPAGQVDGFEPAVPDHANDPTSKANPNNAVAA